MVEAWWGHVICYYILRNRFISGPSVCNGASRPKSFATPLLGGVMLCVVFMVAVHVSHELLLSENLEKLGTSALQRDDQQEIGNCSHCA